MMIICSAICRFVQQHGNLFNNIYINVEIWIKICSSYIDYDLDWPQGILKIKILIERKGEREKERGRERKIVKSQ